MARMIDARDLHNFPGYKPIPESDIHTPAEPTPEHRDRLSSALKDLEEFQATHGEHGAQFTSASGKVHHVGDVVSVDGHKGRIIRKHPVSGLPEIAYK
jgi:hypothetical protein